MSKVPEIRIFYSWLLAGNESKVLAEKWGHRMHSEEQFKKWTNNYRNEWSKYEDKIIPALQVILGVEFYKPVIDVPCAPSFVPKSDPLIMSFSEYPEEFVDVLAHELCHVLLTDNNKIQINNQNNKILLGDIWEDLFGQHEFNELVHIPVQAMLKYVYLDVLKEPERLLKDIERSKNYAPAYSNSWQYVEENGYKEIIAKLKKTYEELSA